MIRHGLFAVACAGFAAGALAGQEDRSAQLKRLEERLVELRAQEEELGETIRRHAAGASVSELRWLAVTDVDRARASSSGTEAVADGMRDRSEALRVELAELDAKAAEARVRARVRAEGDSLPRPEELARLVDPDRGVPAETAPTGAAPVPTVTDPVVVRGSDDHLRTGRALLGAGISLLREADVLDREGRTEVAAARRAQGRERLEAAHAELEPIARGADAAAAALFALARCEEKLGRIGIADALYAAVMERDRTTGSSGRVDYGPFGRAARTARAVMGWLADTSDWRPRRDVDRIRWDDR